MACKTHPQKVGLLLGFTTFSALVMNVDPQDRFSDPMCAEIAAKAPCNDLQQLRNDPG